MDHHRLHPITDTRTPTRHPTRIPIMDTIPMSHLRLDSAMDSVADLAAIEDSGAKFPAGFKVGGLAAAGPLAKIGTQSEKQSESFSAQFNSMAGVSTFAYWRMSISDTPRRAPKRRSRLRVAFLTEGLSNFFPSIPGSASPQPHCIVPAANTILPEEVV